MAARLTLLLLGAAYLICAFAQTENVQEGKKRCERALPLMPWQENYRVFCKYLCLGFPMRFENEEDGIGCGPFNLLGRVCKDGECVKKDSPPAKLTTAFEQTGKKEHETTNGTRRTKEPEDRSTTASGQNYSSVF
ncbi:uncharacterized protein LOC144139509 [Haemaphysalis longicornis]